MAQFVTRLDDDLARAVDALIREGVVESRSDAVRRGLLVLLDHHRRRATADAIRSGYLAVPQTEAEVGWADQATIRMIGDEPW